MKRANKKKNDGDVFTAILNAMKPEMMPLLRAMIETSIDEILKGFK